MRLDTNSPLTTSSMTERATCVASSRPRIRTAPRSLVRPPPRRTDSRSPRPMCQAGASATASAANRAVAAPKARTRASIETSCTRGRLIGAAITKTRSAVCASATPGHAAGRGEDDLINYDGANQAPAACAKRDADGRLAEVSNRPRQRQAREIRARDQQQPADRAKQQQKSAAHRSDDRFLQWHQPGAEFRRPASLAPCDLGNRSLQDVHLSARLLQRHSGLQACDDAVVELSHPVEVRERDTEGDDCGELTRHRSRLTERLKSRQGIASVESRRQS